MSDATDRIIRGFANILSKLTLRLIIFIAILKTDQIWNWKISTIYWINILILSRDDFPQIKKISNYQQVVE